MLYNNLCFTLSHLYIRKQNELVFSYLPYPISISMIFFSVFVQLFFVRYFCPAKLLFCNCNNAALYLQ